MRGSAVPTIVWSSELRNRTRSTAPSTANRARGASVVGAISPCSMSNPPYDGPAPPGRAPTGARPGSGWHPVTRGDGHEGGEEMARPLVLGHLLRVALDG